VSDVSRPEPRPVRTVRAEDGVPLHVELDGDPRAPLTVILTHGFTASLREWEPQLPALRPRARVVLWDHRGHGRSGRTRPSSATIDRTGHDLGAVLDAVAPTGPVVLAGHSMGGMSVMALARQRPELFGGRVVGVLLLATSAGGLVRTGPLGLFVAVLRRLHLLRLWLAWLNLIAPLLERFRRRGTALGRRFTRHYLFGRDDADPELVREVQELLESTPLPVTLAFQATFIDHDEEAALDVLRRVPVAVVGAAQDRLTPARHSRRMAELLGDSAELLVVPGAGHSVNVTRPEQVNRAFLRLLDRAGQRARAQAGDLPPDASRAG
jgi:pimeloyl-ACP methyl ester carboxylesterase